MIAYSNPMMPHLCRIKSRKKETHDTFTITLDVNDEEMSPVFRPGQFNMLYLYGIGEVPISISGHPQKTGKMVHTIRSCGTVTRGLARLKSGMPVGVRGPFGSSWPVTHAFGRDLLIVAGGIGLAPLRPAIYQALVHRKRFGKLILLYGARSPEDVLFYKELLTWQKRADMTVYLTVDHAISDWDHHVGVVTNLIPRVNFDADDTVAMVCGPEIMMRYAIMALQDREVPENHIYLSMERNMKCAIGLCGHCQLGPKFVCKDGPVFPYHRIAQYFNKREI